VDRCALFVDAGYVLADGAMAVHGTRRRESVSWDYAGLLQFLAGLAAERSGLPLLRCYWYEATVEGRRGADHDALADLPGVKLRLAKMRPGRREGVEGEIHRDLATLARNKAVSDAMVVSAEEDLAGVIADVQDLGMRVTMAHITVDGNWTISRTLRQECDDIAEINASHLRPYVELISGAEPAQADDSLSGQGSLAVIGRTPSFTPAAADGNGNGHQLPAAVYAEPVLVDYPRAVPQPSRQRARDRNAGPDEPGRRREELPAASLPPAPSLPSAPGDDWNWTDAQVSMPSPVQPAFEEAQRPAHAPAPLYQQQPGMGMAQSTGYGMPPSRQDYSVPQEYPVPAGPAARQDLGGPHDLYPSPFTGMAPVTGPVPGGPAGDRVTEMPASRGYVSPDIAAYSPGAPREMAPRDALQGDITGASPLAPAESAYSPGPVAEPETAAGPGAQVRHFPARGPASAAIPMVVPQDQPSLVVPFTAAQSGPQALPQPMSVTGPVAAGAGGYGPGRPQAYSGPQPLVPGGYPAQPGQPPLAGGTPVPGSAPSVGGPMPGHGAPVSANGLSSVNDLPLGNDYAPLNNYAPANGYAPTGGPVPDNGPAPASPMNGLAPGAGASVLGAPVAAAPVLAAGPGTAAPGTAVPAAAAPAVGLAPVNSAAFGGGQPAAAVSLADAVQSAHEEGQEFGSTVARDAPALWLEAVLARKPRMPSDLEARLLQGSSLPIDFLLHDEVRHALRRGFWDALERARR
jgi:hypothetical protein